MENFDPQKQIYSTKELSEIEKTRTISNAELLKNGAQYILNEDTGAQELLMTSEQISHIKREVESLLAKGVLTAENLHAGNLNVFFDEKDPRIGYDFELEQEQRINVAPNNNFEVKKWENHVVDTYDQSGRCRVRVKNGDPRLSLKVPLFSLDTERTKCCVRLEFKPVSDNQKTDLFKIRDLIMQEPGTRVHEKWGTPFMLKNGEKVWINKDQEGNYWIEADENERIENLLPDDVSYLGHSKSKINVKKHEKQEEQMVTFDDFLSAFRVGIESTSRTMHGEFDASVNRMKKGLLVAGEELHLQVEKNIETLAQWIWEHKHDPLMSESDSEKLIKFVAQTVNDGLSENPIEFRVWDVDYGRKVSPENIDNEMDLFHRNLLTKVKEADRGELSAVALARWVELEIDRNIHPFADGCGRVARSLAAFFFARYGMLSPNYGSRDVYYSAMNKGEDAFIEYYKDIS